MYIYIVKSMELSDSCLLANRDWDPVYLSSLFETDFDDFSELWINDINDMELLEAEKVVYKYCPIVEDISMEDSDLCLAVERIEEE